MSGYETEKKMAVEAMRQAAIICTAVQSEISPDVLQKKDRSPVTVADFASQALVCRQIGAGFPEDPVIGEEDSASLKEPENKALLQRMVEKVGAILPGSSPEEICSWIDRGGAKEYSDRFWTLDPIDGTKGFLRKEQYAISLALIENGEIVLGVLGCPNLSPEGMEPAMGEGTAYLAVRGEGAFRIPLSGQGEPEPVKVSSTDDPTEIRFCESVEKAHSSHSDAAKIADYLKIAALPVRLDSQAKYAMVGSGRAEAYLRLPRDESYREKIWDHAGGVILVEEAGGKVTDITGAPLDFTHGRTLAKNKGVIVSSGLVHEPILEAIRSLGIA